MQPTQSSLVILNRRELFPLCSLPCWNILDSRWWLMEGIFYRSKAFDSALLKNVISWYMGVDI